jgi:PAS domain S-box-containing protein
MSSMDWGRFMRGLHQLPVEANTLRRRADDEPVDPATVQGMRTEPDTVVDESGAIQEETLGLSEELARTQQALSAERELYRELFESIPAAYLLTDTVGVVREANQRAVDLLGVEHRFLVGKSLAAFVTADQRRALGQWLYRLTVSGESQEWTLRLQPRNRTPVAVLATVGVARDNTGQVREVRWLVREAPGAAERPSADPGVLAELLTGQSLPPVDGSANAMRNIVDAVREVIETAAGLLGADGGALALLGEDGALRWATATSQPANLLIQCETNFLENPRLDARTTGWPVITPENRVEQRRLRLSPVAARHGVRAVLAAPVRFDGRTVGVLTVVATSPRPWSEEDAQAIRGYAAILGHILVTAADAVEQRRLAGQLQTALDTRVVIEQAKGVLMEREQLPPSEAVQLLRRMARSSRRRMADVAADVIAYPHA